MADKEPIVYLSTGDIAERLGVKQDTIHAYRVRGQMPEPDAMIGDRRGWLPETIDAWNESRPSRFYTPEAKR